MEFSGDFFETFLEGSVDLIIYRDYIVNRRFFIYCSLACAHAREMEEGCIVIPTVLSLQYPLPTLFTDVSFVVTSFLG